MKSPAISSSSPHPLFIPFFFSFFLFFSSADKTAVTSELVSREFFPMEGDLAWIIQVSDLHLSAYHPKRAEDLVGLLGSAIRVIRPDLLLVTGDITEQPPTIPVKKMQPDPLPNTTIYEEEQHTTTTDPVVLIPPTVIEDDSLTRQDTRVCSFDPITDQLVHIVASNVQQSAHL